MDYDHFARTLITEVFLNFNLVDELDNIDEIDVTEPYIGNIFIKIAEVEYLIRLHTVHDDDDWVYVDYEFVFRSPDTTGYETV
jgi:hypothetical protein